MSRGAIVVGSRMALSRFIMMARPTTSVPCSAAAAVAKGATTARFNSGVLRAFSEQVGVGRGGDASGTTTTTTSYDGTSYQHSSDVLHASSPIRRSTATAPKQGYVSPYEKLFERMHANAPTILGTTDEYLEFEKQRLGKRLECGMPEHVLRFITRSWGRTEAPPYVMTKEHQVTVKVHTSDLPLNAQEKEILREIVGKRLNDERKELRLSSNVFASRIENKRHVVSMLDRILVSCQRMGQTLEQDSNSSSPDPK